MAPGESSRPGRSRGEDSRGLRAASRQRGEVARRTLDARAARLVAADLLSRRAWTRAELLTRLKRRGAPDEVAAAVVDDLVSRGHVDDAAFAAAWVQGRGTRGYGVARLRTDLRRRGVASGLIEAAVAMLPSERQIEEARRLAQRRYPALVRTAPARAAVRLRDYLLRRGFGAAIVQAVLRETVPRAEPTD